MSISVTEMLKGYEPIKPRWTIACDYHPHNVDISHYVHRFDPRFKCFDKGAPIRLPYKGN